MKRNPREPLTVKLERHLADDMKKPNLRFRSFLENNFIFRSFIKFLAVFGVCLVIADGVLTPAQSVLGAIQGLKVVAPSIRTDTIVGISCAILVVLYAIQPLGITKLGSTFAPIVVLWLVFNFSFGIYVSGPCLTGNSLILVLTSELLGTEPRSFRRFSLESFQPCIFLPVVYKERGRRLEKPWCYLARVYRRRGSIRRPRCFLSQVRPLNLHLANLLHRLILTYQP